jgi:hypothetical protein
MGNRSLKEMIESQSCEYEYIVLTGRIEEEVLYVQDERIDSKIFVARTILL